MKIDGYEYRDYNDFEEVSISELKDKEVKRIILQYESYDDGIIFHMSNGEIYVMTHRSDCCEEVRIKDVIGDINFLIGNPILLAEESSNNNHKDERNYQEGSTTWTFYKLATIKGYVDITWIGESNGYYSEKVDFLKLNKSFNVDK